MNVDCLKRPVAISFLWVSNVADIYNLQIVLFPCRVQSKTRTVFPFWNDEVASAKPCVKA